MYRKHWIDKWSISIVAFLNENPGPNSIGRKHGELLNHSLYKVTWLPRYQKKKPPILLTYRKVKKSFYSWQNSRVWYKEQSEQQNACEKANWALYYRNNPLSGDHLKHCIGRKETLQKLFFVRKVVFEVVFLGCVFCLLVSLHLDHIQNNKFLE